MPTQLLQLSQDGQTISLIAKPLGEDAEHAITRSDIATELVDLQAIDFFLFDNAIDSALSVINSKPADSDVEVKLQQFVIAERRDAGLLIKTDPDLMKTSVTVIGAYGGTQITGNMLIDALKENHIVKGIRKAKLQELLMKSKQLAPGEKLTMPVAFGRFPVHGTDTAFEPLVNDASQRILRPQSTDDGKVDMLDLGELITVKAGQPIMKLIPATKGCNGFNVLGKEITAIPGNELAFEAGDGTAICEDDEYVLVATKSGVPLRKPCGMQVDDALTLKGVNVTTGHIDFDGSILITGDVTPGMKVSATGNIVVSGFVELGELRAGGDIAVAKGVIGRQQDGKHLPCYLEANGKVTSKFAQFVEIDAGQDVSFSLHALHCIIRTKGALSVVDQIKRHGTLSGGYIETGLGVEALNIGALAGVPTEIVAFTQYTSLRDTLNTAYQLIEDEKAKVHKIKEAQHKLLKIPSSKRPPELVEKVKSSIQLHKQRMAELNMSYQNLRQDYDEQLSNTTITAIGRLFSGVMCQIEKEKLNILQEHGPSMVAYRDRTLQRLPYN